MKRHSIAITDIRRVKFWLSCEYNGGRQNQYSDNRRTKFFHDKPPLVVANDFKPKQRNFFVGADSRLALSDSDLFLDSIDALKVGQQ